MKRIAITGSYKGRKNTASALAAMTGIDLIAFTPFSTIAAKYNMDYDISKCHWPHSFKYSMGAFVEKLVTEQNLCEAFISDAGVFNEITWLMCRFNHIDLLNVRPMINSLEAVIAKYAASTYDFIFLIDSNDPADKVNERLKTIFQRYNLKHKIIQSSSQDEVLNQIVDYLQVKPVLSAKDAILAADNNCCDDFDRDCDL